MTRVCTALALVLAAGIHAAPAQSPPAAPKPPAPQIERPFKAGGNIRMDLSAGQYRIQGTADPAIRIRWTTRNQEEGRAVRARADVTGTEADVAVVGPSHGFSVVIDVPNRSNVGVKLSAGDLTLAAVVGNKDVSAWAGKLVIDIGDPATYRAISASVTAGQIRAQPFQAEKGGLFRSFTWEGKGAHELRVRLTAGDVVLESQSKP